MKFKYLLQILVLAALLFQATPGQAQPPALTALPPVDMFQFPWEQGLAWIAMDAFDNGTKRLTNSPHYWRNGGAIDFAPHVNMQVGEDTSNYWVAAAAAGTVSEVTSCIVKIQHADGWRTEYWHLDNIQVQPFQVVERNQRLGVIADNIHKQVCVGNEWPGPHMHFVIRPNMVGATLSGWLTAYNPLTNRTTFTKDGITLGTYKPLLNVMGAQIVMRETITWDTVYAGNVNNSRYERWPFQFTEQNEFTLTAAAAGSDLVPLLVLLDANGTEISQASGQIKTTLPAGSYFVQIQPVSGSGVYTLVMKRVQTLPEGPSGSVDVDNGSIPVGGTTNVNVRLNEVPAEGYTSAEFTCSIDQAKLQIEGNFTDKGLFGEEAVLVSNWPQSGSFIVAIAGSNGRRATTSGIAFSFVVKGLQSGQANIDCQVRISKGDSLLTTIPSVGATLTITDAAGAAAASAPQMDASLAEPQSAEAAEIPATGIGGDVILADTSMVPTVSIVQGKVSASKTVTISLYNADSTLSTSTTVDWDGTFSLNTAGNTYTAIASAEGFLKAQGTVVLPTGGTASLPEISLIAGDIDHNDVIDQYDALTIGMNYNTSVPSAADLNNDGNINVLDLEILAAHYRMAGALAWE